jgi:nucleotidyltransferase substrate binding protein (TIGR01987 family)
VERLTARVTAADKALATLREALAMPHSVVVRDASIQRFEYTYEVSWKALKAYLRDVEGLACASPNQCFREALRVGLASAPDADSLLQMTADRNLTAHTYVEAIAERIHQRLPRYADLLATLLAAIRARAPRDADDAGL